MMFMQQKWYIINSLSSLAVGAVIIGMRHVRMTVSYSCVPQKWYIYQSVKLLVVCDYVDWSNMNQVRECEYVCLHRKVVCIKLFHH